MLASFPSPLVPATVGDKDEGGGGGTAISLPAQGQVRNGVVSPSRVRLREDMWVSSRTFYVLDAEVRADAEGGCSHAFRSKSIRGVCAGVLFSRALKVECFLVSFLHRFSFACFLRGEVYEKGLLYDKKGFGWNGCIRSLVSLSSGQKIGVCWRIKKPYRINNSPRV